MLSSQSRFVFVLKGCPGLVVGLRAVPHSLALASRLIVLSFVFIMSHAAGVPRLLSSVSAEVPDPPPCPPACPPYSRRCVAAVIALTAPLLFIVCVLNESSATPQPWLLAPHGLSQSMRKALEQSSLPGFRKGQHPRGSAAGAAPEGSPNGAQASDGTPAAGHVPRTWTSTTASTPVAILGPTLLILLAGAVVFAVTKGRPWSSPASDMGWFVGAESDRLSLGSWSPYGGSPQPGSPIDPPRHAASLTPHPRAPSQGPSPSAPGSSL